MKKRKLGIIGGSGSYKMEGFEKQNGKELIPLGKPSDEILQASIGKEEICFIPRHSRGHKISPKISILGKYRCNETIRCNRYYFGISCWLLKEKLKPGKFDSRSIY